MISRLPGFVEFHVVDAGNGEVIGMGIFDDRAGADDFNARAAEYVRQNLASLLPNPPRISVGEVVVYQTRPAARARA